MVQVGPLKGHLLRVARALIRSARARVSVRRGATGRLSAVCRFSWKPHSFSVFSPLVESCSNPQSLCTHYELKRGLRFLSPSKMLRQTSGRQNHWSLVCREVQQHRPAGPGAGLYEAGGSGPAAPLQVRPGLALKNPPKKTQKSPPKKTTKNVFFWVF